MTFKGITVWPKKWFFNKNGENQKTTEANFSIAERKYMYFSEECLSLMRSLMQIRSLLMQSFWMRCHTVHMLTQQCLQPHWLVPWSRHRSHMHILVHSPRLPGYIDVTPIILVILTMAGVFLDRPHTSEKKTDN